MQHENGLKGGKSIDTKLQVAQPERPKGISANYAYSKEMDATPPFTKTASQASAHQRVISHDQLAKEVLFFLFSQRREKGFSARHSLFTFNSPNNKAEFSYFSAHKHVEKKRKREKPFAVRLAINIKREMESKDSAHGGPK